MRKLQKFITILILLCIFSNTLSTCIYATTVVDDTRIVTESELDNQEEIPDVEENEIDEIFENEQEESDTEGEIENPKKENQEIETEEKKIDNDEKNRQYQERKMLLDEKEQLNVSYKTHIQDYGWSDYVNDGKTSGTEGKNKRLEAIKIKLDQSEESNIKIKYQVHVQDYGWMDWKQNGEMAGTEGESKRIEAIRIKLEGTEEFSVLYRTYVQDYGWIKWTNNGEISGTIGESKRVEAIQIKIVKSPKVELNCIFNASKNTVTANVTSKKEIKSISDNTWKINGDKLSATKTYEENDIYNITVEDIDGIKCELKFEINQVIEPISNIKYSSHIQDYGWEKKWSKIDGDISGNYEQDKRLEAIKISLGTSEEVKENASIKYRVYAERYGWMDWKQDGEMAGTTDENRGIKAITLKLENMEEYCVEYKVYIQGKGWQKWKSDGEIAGNTSEENIIEAIQIRVVKKENKTIEPSISYQAHVQNIGWQKEVAENNIVGTTGQAKRVEAIKINLEGVNEDAVIKYQAHVSDYGWQDWKEEGEEVGTTGKSKSIEAIKIKLENLEGYTIEYRVHISGYGWQKWRRNGEVAGTEGQSASIEAIQMRIIYTGAETLEPEVSYQTHVQDIGWQKNIPEGFIAGTEGQFKRIEALKINLVNANSSAKIQYRTHVQDIGWQNWVSSGNLVGTTGQSKRIEAIQIKLEGLDKYTVEYQVHIQDYGWSAWMIDGETAGTTRQNKRIEAIRIRIVPKYYRSYKGIDVSEFNGTINWSAVKNSGVQFAMIRCGYRGYRTGRIVEDSQFRNNITGASAVGIKVGLYFFSQATSISEAAEEANYAINLAQKYNCVTYPIAIDTESSGATNNDGRADGLNTALRTNVVAAFCNQVRNYGYEPMVYASRNWLYNNLEVTRLLNYETWLAHYTGNSAIKSDYRYSYTMWQYTSVGSVPGINGSVDMNIGYRKY